ncbi:hypothetical protein J4430_04070 [Candidatus Woesearchaeota archaeon]|nr:hypothetical protein [Candidatus Woesearchaeota archaeon]
MYSHHRKKRGALELSISTIIIVVIGITLLTLGIVFVKNIFGKLTNLSDDVFDTANVELGQLGAGDARLKVPTTVTVNQGKSKRFDIVIGNDGTTTGSSFTLRLTRSGSAATIPEIQVQARIIVGTTGNSHTLTISPGRTAKVPLQVIAISTAPLTNGANDPAYAVEVTSANGDPYETSAFVINVEKGAGFFG